MGKTVAASAATGAGTITLRLNEDERRLFENVTKLSGGKISTWIKSAAREKAENDLWYKKAEDAYNEWLRDGKKTYTLDEVWEHIGGRPKSMNKSPKSSVGK